MIVNASQPPHNYIEREFHGHAATGTAPELPSLAASPVPLPVDAPAPCDVEQPCGRDSPPVITGSLRRRGGRTFRRHPCLGDALSLALKSAGSL